MVRSGDVCLAHPAQYGHTGGGYMGAAVKRGQVETARRRKKEK
jgi:hypothetical protein